MLQQPSQSAQCTQQLLLSLALRAIGIHRRDIGVDVEEHLEAYTRNNLNRFLLQTSINATHAGDIAAFDLEVSAAAHARLCQHFVDQTRS